jgi:hypothetical protein
MKKKVESLKGIKLTSPQGGVKLSSPWARRGLSCPKEQISECLTKKFREDMLSKSKLLYVIRKAFEMQISKMIVHSQFQVMN